MKIISIIVSFVAATVHSNAQGSVSFSNLASPISSSPRVFIQTDAGTTFVPAGSQFSAELVFAPDGTTQHAFAQVATRVGAATSFSPFPGIFIGGNRTVAAITPAGGFGLFQVRVWETAGGSDYRSAITTGQRNIRAGTSAILRVDTADATTTPPGDPVSLVAAGLTSFTLTAIPEPSTIALILLSTSALLILLKVKSARPRSKLTPVSKRLRLHSKVPV
jgi:hypothetical protein